MTTDQQLSVALRQIEKLRTENNDFRTKSNFFTGWSIVATFFLLLSFIGNVILVSNLYVKLG